MEKSKNIFERSNEHTEKDYVEEFKRIILDAADPKYRNIGGKILILRMYYLERIARLVKEMQFQIDQKKG